MRCHVISLISRYTKFSFGDGFLKAMFHYLQRGKPQVKFSYNTVIHLYLVPITFREESDHTYFSATSVSVFVNTKGLQTLLFGKDLYTLFDTIHFTLRNKA